MSYEKGQFAFFDGTSSEYRKVAKADETIAGFKVSQIGHNYVKLAKGSNDLQLRVGMQLRRENEGEWRTGGVSEDYARSTSSTSSSSAPTPFAGSFTRPGSFQGSMRGAPPGTPGGPAVSTPSTASAGSAPSGPSASSGASEEEIIKKMMQQREQELR